MDLQFRKMLGYKWGTIIEHIKKLTGKEYSVSYLRKIMNRTEKNKRLIPILEDMGLMEERKNAIDIDGNEYNVIKLGDLYWTISNLKTTKLNDGTDIELMTDYEEWKDAGDNNIPAYCYYDNDMDNKNKYGALYNFHAISTGKLAPEGWRVPTDDDWTNLEKYLIKNGYNWDGSTSGNKIAKSMAANTDWETDNYNDNTDWETDGIIGYDLTQNNKSGFSALPGGVRDDYGDFYSLSSNGSDGYWWSSTEDNESIAYNRFLCHNESLNKDYSGKGSGLSVRLVRDVKKYS